MPLRAGPFWAGDLRSYFASRLGLRIWYGIGLEVWLPMLFRHGHTISVWQLPRIFLFTLLSAINSILGLQLRLIFGQRIGEVRLHPAPIFVLGHWRSGTTFLHELMASDARFISPRGYQCGAPRIFLLMETWFRPLLNYFFPRQRPMDEMRLDLERAQEDEYALLGLTGRSNLRSFIFPSCGPLDREYLSLRDLDEASRALWLDQWIYFLKSVAIRHGDDQRLILKSPQHTARVRTILQVFPRSKFVLLVRNPLAVYESTVRTWKTLCDTQGVQRKGSADAWIPGTVLSVFEEMHRCFEEDRRLIPPGNLQVLRYEDLAANPMRALEQIYSAFELGDPRDCVEIRNRIAESSGYRPHRSSLSAAEVATVASRWPDFIARYGYSAVVDNALRLYETKRYAEGLPREVP